MKVLVLYTLPSMQPGSPRSLTEFDLQRGAYGVANVLPKAVVAGVRGEVFEILAALEKHSPDVVFNLCEAPSGRSDLEPHAASLFEWLGVRFTGSGSDTLALC